VPTRSNGSSRELTEEDLRLENEEAEQRLEELRGQGYIIEETPLGVLLCHEDDAEGTWGDNLQAEFDRAGSRGELAVCHRAMGPPNCLPTDRRLPTPAANLSTAAQESIAIVERFAAAS
jgi:hypothetical protein